MTPNKLPPLPERALSRETMAFCLERLIEVVESAISDGDWKVDGACDPDMALTFAKRALGISPEHRNAEALRQSQSLPAEEPVAWWNGARESKLDDSLLPSVSWTGENTHHDIPLFAGCNPHSDIVRKAAAYDAMQSLPAGAVAGLLKSWRASADECVRMAERLGDASPSLELHRDAAQYRMCADQIEAAIALQADAREKGEAVPAAWLYEFPFDPDEGTDHSLSPIRVLESWVSHKGATETALYRADVVTNLRREIDLLASVADKFRLANKELERKLDLATQPAQASEKDNGFVSVPRDALIVEARRLRYRATETCGLGPEQSDAGAQMIHTAEALEGFASSGQEKE